MSLKLMPDIGFFKSPFSFMLFLQNMALQRARHFAIRCKSIVMPEQIIN